MADLDDSGLYKFLKNDDFDFEPKKRGFMEEGSSIIKGSLLALIFFIWALILLNFISYKNEMNKYGAVLKKINFTVKQDSLKYNKVGTNLSFFKEVSNNQVNVSNLLYIMSLHRFGRTYVKSLSVKNGKVHIVILSLNDGFLRSLNIMSDYGKYLNIYTSQIHTGTFAISSLKTLGKDKGNIPVVEGIVSSKRFS